MIAIILITILLIGAVIVHYSLFTKPFPGHNDFLSRWEGARTFFQDGYSPYSEQASLNIQNRIYGRPVIENEDPGFFVYPFYTVFIIAPTVPVDYAWAAAIWMVFLEVCLIVALLLLLDLYEWRPSRWLVLLLFLWALFDYFAGRGLFLGQPSHVVYMLQVATLWFLHRKQDGIAGVILALSTFKPQLGYLIVPFLLLWGLRVQRRRFVVGFGIAFSGLMGASFLLQPDWFGDWVAQVRLYPEYTAAAYPDTGSIVWIIFRHFLDMGQAVEWIATVALILPLLWGWYMVLVQGRQDKFLWVVALTLVISHLIGLRTATPHFVIFNIILIFYFKHLKGWLVALILFVLLISSWAQFLITVSERATLEHPAMFLPLPLLMFALLMLTRRHWWQAAPRFAS